MHKRLDGHELRNTMSKAQIAASLIAFGNSDRTAATAIQGLSLLRVIDVVVGMKGKGNGPYKTASGD
jgi:hypothetical protein